MNNRGFTLVEVIVSIFIIGIVVIGIFPMFSQAFNSIFSSGDKVQQVHNAKIELLNKLSNPVYTSSVITNSSGIVLEFIDSDGNNVFSLTTTKYNASGNYKLPGGNNNNLSIEYYILE